MPRSALLTTAALLAGTLGAAAADGAARPAPPGRLGLFSEVRLGVLAHDPWSPERGSVDIHGQILFKRPLELAPGWQFLVPRAHLGGALNSAGRTSHLDFGLTWSLDLGRRVFVEAGFGSAVHDGRTGRIGAANRSALGCAVLFREAFGLGYRIDARWSIIASVEHLSNGGFCTRNRGLTNSGMAIGYSF